MKASKLTMPLALLLGVSAHNPRSGAGLANSQLRVIFNEPGERS